jgi:hypothetical protein
MRSEFKRVEAFFEKLDQAELRPFPAPRGSIDAPSTHGVYAIVAPKRVRVFHVGRTVTGRSGLKYRLSNHLHGRSSFVTLYLKPHGYDIRDCWFKYIEVESARVRALLEAYATGRYCPAHIGVAQSVLDAQEIQRDAA